MTSSDLKKNELRRKCRQARGELTSAKRDEASSRICDTVTRAGYFRRSRNIGCYLPSDVEVDTWPIIARAFSMEKWVSAPFLRKNGSMSFRELTADTRLSPNQFGLLEPQEGEFVDPHCLDIVIVPTVAFDSSCNRIGMGGGYFDRTFAFLSGRKFWLHPKLIGVAFDCQRTSSIAPNHWDIKLFRVVTESGQAFLRFQESKTLRWQSSHRLKK
jgi:5-formyltetrahydrofolate cyclo-ligase